MQKWEYCRIAISSTTVSEEVKQDIEATDPLCTFVAQDAGMYTMNQAHLRRYRANSEAEDIADVGEAIEQLGLDGWEMVSCTADTALSGVTTTVFYFKRPLQEQADTMSEILAESAIPPLVVT